MKTPVAFALLLFPLFSSAADLQGDIYGVDVAASSVTISANTKLTTYRLRPTAEITINGVKAKLTELDEGMTAKVVSAEPSFATKIIASGVPKIAAESSPALVASAKQIQALNDKLKDSKWDLKNGKTFTLHADGTTTGSWLERKGSWKVSAPDAIDMHINWAPGKLERVTVSPDANFLRWGGTSAVRMKK